MKAIFALGFLALSACATNSDKPVQPQINQGKQLAFGRDKGNCLACHEIEEGEFPGNIGPALNNLPTRFKDKGQLRDQIWDATRFNPETSMPPFGKNKILTETEIDQVVDYLWGIK